MTEEIELSKTDKNEIDAELSSKGLQASGVMLMTKKNNTFDIVTRAKK